MNNLNEKCVLLYDKLSTRRGVKRIKLTKAQLAESPYILTCDSYYIGGSKQANEVINKGAVLVDKKTGRDTVCLLVRDLATHDFSVKVLNVKPDSAMSLDHMIKISYDKNGAIKQEFLQRKESVYEGSLSAFCKPPSLQDVVNYVTAPNFEVGLA